MSNFQSIGLDIDMSFQKRFTISFLLILISSGMLSGCGGSKSIDDVSSSSSSGAIHTDPPAVFVNPLFSNGADPWMQWYEGNYYLVTTTWTSQLVMRKSPTIEGLKTAPPVYVWSDTSPDRCCNFWAFEFHRLHGPSGPRWYLMFTAGHAADLNRQHLVVLESEGDDPMGPYRLAGEPIVERWNIDGTYLEANDQIYVLWSEWDGDLQKNWIQGMSNPWTVVGSRSELSSPQYDWERQSGIDNPGLVNEAPEVLQRNNRTFVTYSASSCNGPEYKLGMLELVGDDPLKASSWHKFPDPVFEKGNGAFGTGHNGFFKSPDGAEDWLVYHANSSVNQGCGDSRSVRAQPILWNTDGTPNFGDPVAAGEEVRVPSGEAGPLTALVQGAAIVLINEGSDYCLSGNREASSVLQTACNGDIQTQWVLDGTNDGHFRLANKKTGLFLQASSCSSEAASVSQGEWRNQDCQKWKVESSSDGWLQFVNAAAGYYLGAESCGAENVTQSTGRNKDCAHWRLQPAKQVAIVSAQSGKALDVLNCSTALGANVQQYEWLGSPCQKWKFESSTHGYVKLKPVSNINSCLGYEFDGNLVQGSCSNTASDFYINPLSDGAISLYSRDNAQVLDVDNCSIENSANVQLYQWLDNQCQRFYFRQVIQAEAAQSGNQDPITHMPVQPQNWELSGNLGSHDPTIIEENGIWWEFQTGVGIYGKRSNDGLDWTPLPSVLPQALSWWKNYVPEHSNNDVWAPDVHIFNGRAWMYYSISTFGSKVSVIGLISATSFAEGDWRDEGLVIATDNTHSYNAIDPNLIVTPEGEPWMVFGSWNSGIMLTKIDENSMKPTGQLFNLAKRGGGIEGPTLSYRNGYYYLFVSVGRCCAGTDSTYQVLVGRSTNITGPYLDKNGDEMLNGSGSIVKQTSGNWIGPGGQDIHNGVIAYHAYDANQNGDSFLRIETLGWSIDNWPYLP